MAIYRDRANNLPPTDPFDRQLSIGMGCFLQQLAIAASADGYHVELSLFPAGDEGTAVVPSPRWPLEKKTEGLMQNNNPGLFFAVFTEIGIIEQLSRALLEARLPKGLIAPHFAALNHLMPVGDGATPIQMARAFQVPKTSMTHTISGLVKHGLVDVRPNPDDRRSKCVWLTDTGRALRAQVIADLAPEFQGLATQFDTSRLADILPVLADLRGFLDNHRNTKPEGRPVADKG